MVIKPVDQPPAGSATTPATKHDPGYLAAVEQAKLGLSEGGIPIGACLVGADGKIIGKGRNLRVQKGSATLHVCSNPLQSD